MRGQADLQRSARWQPCRALCVSAERRRALQPRCQGPAGHAAPSPRAPRCHAGGGLCPGLNDVVQNIVYTLVRGRRQRACNRACSGVGRGIYAAPACVPACLRRGRFVLWNSAPAPSASFCSPQSLHCLFIYLVPRCPLALSAGRLWRARGPDLRHPLWAARLPGPPRQARAAQPHKSGRHPAQGRDGAGEGGTEQCRAWPMHAACVGAAACLRHRFPPGAQTHRLTIRNRAPPAATPRCLPSWSGCACGASTSCT